MHEKSHQSNRKYKQRIEIIKENQLEILELKFLKQKIHWID